MTFTQKQFETLLGESKQKKALSLEVNGRERQGFMLEKDDA